MSDPRPMVDFNTYKRKEDATAVKKEISTALDAAGVSFRVEVRAAGSGFQIGLYMDCYPHILFEAVPLELVASWKCRHYGFSEIEGVSSDAIGAATARLLLSFADGVAEDKRMEAILTAVNLVYNRFLQQQAENMTLH